MMLFCETLFAEGQNSVSEYKLGSGDKLSIVVFDEDDLSIEAVLSDAGTISYPFLGELEVKGKTLSELENLVIGGLKGPYLIDPKVNVKVIEYRPFYIHGEVVKSGGYPYQPGLTLRKAITLAGGFTERASKTKIYVRRDGVSSGQPELITMDDYIFPGDTVTVEQSFF
ncbi:MAG: polysaccharide export protein [Pseudomonadales bacterium]|nr:polysaccharide export protein [Pseudomonadales bacterium]